MILRKPYALLIKYFKIIHIGLFMMFGYILFKLKPIYVFFSDYVKNEAYTYIENMASKYIDKTLFIIPIIVLIFGILVFYLMKKKEKPVVFYGFLIIYTCLLIGCLIIDYNFFVSLESVIHERFVISVYRDVAGFIYYTAYFFLIFSFIRGFGFDIRKFRFDKDLKVLNISEEDNEEFEVDVNFDKENIINSIRKEKRMLGYFLKENALLLSIILIVFLTFSGFFIYRYIQKNYVFYHEKEDVVANNLVYYINNTYYTNKDKYGNTLGNNYIVLDFNIVNKNNSVNQINLSKTILANGNDFYYPITNRYNLFDDIGVGYNNEKLVPFNENNYILVFKIPVDFSKLDNLFLEVFDYETYQNERLIINRQKIKLKPKKFSEKIHDDFFINDEISFEENLLENVKWQILSYELKESYIYEYEKCENDVCQNYKKVIQSQHNYPVLKIESKATNFGILDISSYLSIEYTVLGATKTISQVDLNVLYHDLDYLYLDTSDDLDKADKIILKLNIRGSIYNIVLKG